MRYLYVASVAFPAAGSGGDLLRMATLPGRSSSFSDTVACAAQQQQHRGSTAVYLGWVSLRCGFSETMSSDGTVPVALLNHDAG